MDWFLRLGGLQEEDGRGMLGSSGRWLKCVVLATDGYNSSLGLSHRNCDSLRGHALMATRCQNRVVARSQSSMEKGMRPRLNRPH